MALINTKDNIRRELGFTLVELLIVIAIIVTLAAISLPAFLNPQHRVKKVARELMSDMQRTKMSAVKNNETWRIVFNANGYTIQDGIPSIQKTVNFDSYATGVGYGNGAATTNANVGGGPFTADFVSYDPNQVTFNSRGTSINGWVYIAYGDSAYAIGTLTSGIIRIRVWSGGAWR